MSEFFLQIESLLKAIGDPEYRFLVMEPLITYGLLTGVIMISIGFFIKAPRLQVAALIVIGTAALLYFPYTDARVHSEPRLEQIYEHAVPSRAKGFSETTQAWIGKSWLFKILILSAGATVLIGVQRNRLGFGFSIATLVLGLWIGKDVMWLNYQDALAYHPNLRRHEAPVDQRLRDSSITRSTQKERRPEFSIAQPVAPAVRVSEPSIPVPGTEIRTGPQTPASSRASSSTPRVREIVPLPHR